MHITFVKKILSSGELCKKCRDVSERLSSEGLINSINHIAIADENDANSEGVRLAKKHDVARAPFFLVEHNGETIVFDVYFKFKKFMASHNLGNANTEA